YALAAATAIWPARTAPHSTMPTKAI
ncbi:anaerobic dimethyl sulfoxide reductase chain B, partial [Klebsiella pneumoniae]